MKATILYKTDHHHSYSSRDLVGVFTNKREFVFAVKKIIKDDQSDNPNVFDTEHERQRYIAWNIDFFLEKGQTQGLSGFELFSEQIELNKIF